MQQAHEKGFVPNITLCVLHNGDFHQNRICKWTTQLKVQAWNKILTLIIRLEDNLIQVCFLIWHFRLSFQTIKDFSSSNPKCNACSNYQRSGMLLYANTTRITAYDIGAQTSVDQTTDVNIIKHISNFLNDVTVKFRHRLRK